MLKFCDTIIRMNLKHFFLIEILNQIRIWIEPHLDLGRTSMATGEGAAAAAAVVSSSPSAAATLSASLHSRLTLAMGIAEDMSEESSSQFTVILGDF